VVAAFKEMKWAITGGSGQLSRSLVDLLDKEGVPYIAWSHKDLDVADDSSISVIKEISPDLLINCAAWTNVDAAEEFPEKATRVNQVGPRNMARAAKELKIPLIHISTDYVFSGQSRQPWSTDSKTEPISTYGLSKLLGEKEISKNLDADFYILRTAWLYGPYGRNFSKTILKKALTSKDSINVVNDQIGQPTTTKSLAEQIFKVAKQGIPSGTYHATNTGQASWWDFAREIFELAGEDVERVRPSTSEDFPSNVKRPKYSVLDQSAWSKVGMETMPEWRRALKEVFPEIRKAVEREL
jgi:dTDP-4-dehydrorhamnose reductase